MCGRRPPDQTRHGRTVTVSRLKPIGNRFTWMSLGYTPRVSTPRRIHAVLSVKLLVAARPWLAGWMQSEDGWTAEEELKKNGGGSV